MSLKNIFIENFNPLQTCYDPKAKGETYIIGGNGSRCPPGYKLRYNPDNTGYDYRKVKWWGCARTNKCPGTVSGKPEYLANSYLYTDGVCNCACIPEDRCIKDSHNGGQPCSKGDPYYSYELDPSLKSTCHNKGYYNMPLDMPGHNRTVEERIEECQDRCKNVDECKYFSYFNDGGCHISDKQNNKIKSLNAVTGEKYSVDCCKLKGKYYSPINMPNQERTVEQNAKDCYKRCKSTKGCKYFSYWKDRGCHIQDSNAKQKISSYSIAGSMDNAIMFKRDGDLYCPKENFTVKEGFVSEPSKKKICTPVGPSRYTQNKGSENRISGVAWPIKLGATSEPEDCAKKCEENEECDGFHFYGKNDSNAKGHCYIQKGVTGVGPPLSDGIDRYAGFCEYKTEDKLSRHYSNLHEYKSLFDESLNKENYLNIFWVNNIQRHYNDNTQDSKNLHDTKMDLNKIADTHAHLLKIKTQELKELENSNNTNKRKIEINMNDRMVKNHRSNKLKYVFLAVFILTLFPLLAKFEVIPKMIVLILWLIVVFVLFIYIYFVFYVQERNRDDSNFNERNFIKPSDHEISRSRLMLEIDEKDKEKCAALSELSIDPSNFIVDDEIMAKYYTKKNDPAQKCTS
jgi:hypothetical protein